MKCSVDPIVSCCMVKGVSFFATSEYQWANMKVKLRLNRARPNFSLIRGNLNVYLGIVDCSFYSRRFVFKVDCHKNKNCLHSPLKSLPIYRVLQKLFFVFPTHLRIHFQPCSSSLDCFYRRKKISIRQKVH